MSVATKRIAIPDRQRRVVLQRIPLADVQAGFISFTENYETTFSASNDFRASCADFEDEVRQRLLSSGELKRFRANMKALARMVKKGTFRAEWITCEMEDSRIDIFFTPGKVECVIYPYVVELE